MPFITVIATSLNEDSRSQRLARAFTRLLKENEDTHELVDLRDLNLPLTGSGASYGHPDVIRLKQSVAMASHILFVSPVYNFDLNSAAKVVAEFAGREMSQKVVGFACAAGGQGSYMSPMSFANSLMLDFRCVIVPRFLYTTSADWQESGELQPQAAERMARLRKELLATQFTPVDQ